MRPLARFGLAFCALSLIAILPTAILPNAQAIDVRPVRKIESSDFDRLRGQWAGPGDMVWEFAGDRYRIYSAGNLIADLRIKLDETKKPRQFDVWYDGDDVNLQQTYPAANPYKGIYEFKGQQLIRCFTGPGGERPKAFDAGQGSLSTLERVAPAKRASN